jgi:hypothetical protein
MLSIIFAGTSGKELVSAILEGSGEEVVLGVLAVVALSAIPTVLCFWPERQVAPGVHSPAN